MAVKPIPDGQQSVTPYLIVRGAGRLIDFLKQAFDAKVIASHAGPDGTVMHGQVQIGGSMVMMGDASDQWPAMPAALHLYVTDTDATYRRALQAGATSLREPTDEFYGDRAAGVKDAFGNQWWIATHVEDVTPEEMARRSEEAMAKRSRG